MTSAIAAVVAVVAASAGGSGGVRARGGIAARQHLSIGGGGEGTGARTGRPGWCS